MEARENNTTTQSEAHTEAQKPSKHTERETERDSEAKAERHYMCAHDKSMMLVNEK